MLTVVAAITTPKQNTYTHTHPKRHRNLAVLGILPGLWRLHGYWHIPMLMKLYTLNRSSFFIGQYYLNKALKNFLK